MVERSFKFEIPTWEELKELTSVCVCFDYGGYYVAFDKKEIKVKHDKIIVKSDNKIILTRIDWEKFELGNVRRARFVEKNDENAFAYITQLCFRNGTVWDNPFSSLLTD